MDKSSIPPKVRGQISGETWLSRVGVRGRHGTRPRTPAEYPLVEFKGNWGSLGWVPDWSFKEVEENREMNRIRRHWVAHQVLPKGQVLNDDNWERHLRSQMWWTNYMRERRRRDA